MQAETAESLGSLRARLAATCAVCQEPSHPGLDCADAPLDWAARKARAMAWHPGKHGLNNPPYVYEEAKR